MYDMTNLILSLQYAIPSECKDTERSFITEVANRNKEKIRDGKICPDWHENSLDFPIVFSSP